jgi:hypothetical protein
MTGPVYFYYGLKNYYQNHHKFMVSKSANQLASKKQYGNINEVNTFIIKARADCGSKVTN